LAAILWFSKFTPLEDEIYPRLRTIDLVRVKTKCPALWREYSTKRFTYLCFFEQ